MGKKGGNLKHLFKKKEMLFNRLQKVSELISLFPEEGAVEEFKKLTINLDDSRVKFEMVVDEINEHSEDDYDYSECEKYNEMYCGVKKVLLGLVGDTRIKEDAGAVQKETSVRLPKLDIPYFEGELRGWAVFWETFKKIIHENPNLSPGQKVQYLVGRLKGRALAVVSSIPATGANYEVIVGQLCDKYQDDYKIAKFHVNEMFSFKPIVRLTANALDAFLERFVSSFKALKNLSIPDLADFLVLQLAETKIDPETFKSFQMIVRNEKFPTFEQLVTFLNQQTRVVDNSKPSYKQTSQTSSFLISTSVHKKEDNNCKYCRVKGHGLVQCSKFLKLNPQERFNFIKNKRLCYNCLSSEHFVTKCISHNRCQTCNKLHNTLLHFRETKVSELNCNKNGNNSTVTLYNQCKNNNFVREIVLLPTALVLSGYNNSVLVRVLLDSASQSNLITVDCCKKLGLKKEKFWSSLYGLGGVSQSILGKTTLRICSRLDQTQIYTIEALIVHKISNPLPHVKIDNFEDNILLQYELADYEFNTPGKVDLVIGAEMYPQIVKGVKGRVPESGCHVLETTLGDVIMGKTRQIDTQNSGINSFVIVNEPVEPLLRKFFEDDEIENPQKDDVQCEKMFLEGVSRNEQGRYVVKLPFKEDYQTLGDSYGAAKQRFLSLEKRFECNVKLKSLYSEIIRDYLEKGYLGEVAEPNSVGYYIPHHGVWKPESVSTPLRIVLDANTKTTSGKSLNDVLHTGAKLHSDPNHILMSFRLFKVAFIADIEKMYMQIVVNREHTKFQRVLWRFNKEENLSVLELKRVGFGLRSSPFLALRVIKQLATDESVNFPLACEFVPRDMYVDDIICSVPDSDLAGRLYEELTLLFRAGGFELGKWSTNSLQLYEKMAKKVDQGSRNLFCSEVDSSHKVLGLRWDSQKDCFYYTVTHNSKIATKRNILSMIARMFDPLGMISPVMLTAKELIKRLWQAGLDWDEDPPSDIKGSWESFLEDLQCLPELEIPRYVFAVKGIPVDIIGFCDGSYVGYGANVYIRVVSSNIYSNLLCSKGKVTSLKPMTIPRIELCAAALLAQLLRSVISCVEKRVIIRNIFAFSDSQVVLHWINTSKFRGQTFIANRVTRIRDCLDQSRWFYVTSKENPADLVSRGVTVKRLIGNKFWWEGPSWLLSDYTHWPISQNFGKNEDTKVEAVQTMICVQKMLAEGDSENSILQLVSRVSSWTKLLRIMGYILKILKRTEVKNNGFSAEDINIAEEYVIKVIQKTYLGEEISLINKDKLTKSSIIKWCPFLDEKGILRVGGRLRNANLKFDKKHPILIPKESRIVKLIIDFYHRRYFHPGLNMLISVIREKFWIINVRRLAKKYISSCIGCFKLNPREISSLMADLPKYRIEESRTFAHTGVDYAGPFSITLRRGRGQKSQKAYLCLFICMNTKAVHLEVCSDLSTGNFLNALKRFTARRGVCEVLYSDQGTNFVGARNILKEVYELSRSEEYKSVVGNYLAENRIKWRFNPPGAPHFGGLWEATIKSFKRHLYRTIGSQILSLEEFQTICTQIEAILNSRPLTVLSEDPSEPSVLTPSHFLVAKPLVDLPGTQGQAAPYNSRPRLLENIVRDFWGRWSKEYLNTLQIRQKWNKKQKPITQGTLVLLRDQNVPPLNWPLGIVEEVFPAQDGQVRVAQIRTAKGSYKRPVVKLCPVPLQDD